MELTQDPSSVYYLQPSDHTGMKLVSTTFNGSGYANWKRSMMIGLTAKNKMSFVDGTLAKPESTDPNYKSWCRCNSMVIGWIITALESQIAASILYMDSAREIWIDLEERYGQATSAQIYAIQQEIFQTSQDNLHIAEYYTQLKKLWDEMDNLKPLPTCECTNCECNISQKFLKIQQDQRLMIFLMKLTNNYANVRSHILMMESMPSLPQAYRMLLQEQRHREISMPASHESIAFAADRAKFDKGFPNRNVYQPRHRAFNQTPRPISNRRINYYCDHCKVPGHSMERCFKLNGYPPDFRANQTKKYAACVTSDDVPEIVNNGETTSKTAPSHNITTEQHTQLMALLNLKQQEKDGSSHNSSEIGNDFSGNALFAERVINDQVFANLEVDKQVEVRDIMLNSGSENERARVEAGVVNEVMASVYAGSSGLNKDDGSELLADGSVASEEKHTVRIEAAAPLIIFIKEKESSARKKIEDEMGVQIIFRLGEKDEYIIIEGISRECVTTASEKLQILIKEAIKSPALNYTHFVSLPLAIHPQLVAKLFNFQNSILGISSKNEATCLDDDNNEDTTDEESREIQSDSAAVVAVDLIAEEGSKNKKAGIRNIPPVSYPPKASKPSQLDEKTTALSALGIDKSIFSKPKTFHLTVLMLKLYNKDLVDSAANVLQSLPTKIMHALDGQPVAVRLKGLECMRGSFAKARVLYAPVKVIGGEDRLLRACQVIIDAFAEAGLVLEKDAHHKLKLHATLMNTSHRKRNNRTRRADTFDARGIVEQFGSEEWGEYLIREAHLSRMSVYDENGYYQCRASIPFPEKCQ